MRHPLSRAAAEPVFVQPPARRLRDLPRCRASDRHRLRLDRPGRNEDAARRRDPALAIAELPRVPGRHREIREEARRSARHSFPRSRSERAPVGARRRARVGELDRKSTRLNSSHQIISYAVFCLKKKKYMIIAIQFYHRYDKSIEIVTTTT